MDIHDAIPDELRERHGFPKDVWERAEVLAALYVEWLGPQVTDGDAEHVLTVSIAKAIMAERNRAIEACEAQKAVFQSEQYAYPQPMGSFSECLAVDECIKAIRGDHQ